MSTPTKLFAKKKKIEVGKWDYRGFVIEKIGKLWTPTKGDKEVLSKLEESKTIKAICLEIDIILGNDSFNENDSVEVKPIATKKDYIEKDIKLTLSNFFTKTKGLKIEKDKNGKPCSITFKVIALDATFEYKDKLMFTFASDIIRNKRKEFVILEENTSNQENIRRIRNAKTLLAEIDKEKLELEKTYKGFDLMTRKTNLEDKHFVEMSFSVSYIDNEEKIK